MGNTWVVAPEVDRLTLQWGDREFWVEVKRRLNTGEMKRLFASGFKSVSQVSEDSTEMNIDWDRVMFVKVQTYLADWSLADDQGNKLVHNLDTLRALDPDVFGLIEKAIDRHIAAQEAQTKAVPFEKKLRKTSGS